MLKVFPDRDIDDPPFEKNFVEQLHAIRISLNAGTKHGRFNILQTDRDQRVSNLMNDDLLLYCSLPSQRNAAPHLIRHLPFLHDSMDKNNMNCWPWHTSWRPLPIRTGAQHTSTSIRKPLSTILRFDTIWAGSLLGKYSSVITMILQKTILPNTRHRGCVWDDRNE
jgi:hypothetical protein